MDEHFHNNYYYNIGGHGYLVWYDAEIRGWLYCDEHSAEPRMRSEIKIPTIHTDPFCPVTYDPVLADSKWIAS